MNLNPLTALRERAKQWAIDVAKLMKTRVAPSDQAKKDALIARARTIKETLESVLGTVDELAPIGLGFLPLIAVGAIASAAALITYWYTDYNKVMVGAVAFNRVLDTGGTVEQAVSASRNVSASTVANMQSSGGISFMGFTVGIPMLLGAGALIAFLVMRKK